MLSQWSFALAAGCLGFLLLYVLLRSVPDTVRKSRLFWLFELASLPVLISFSASLLVSVLDFAEGSIWSNRIQEVKGVILALIFAYLGDRALSLFIWDGLLRRYKDTLPGIVRNLATFIIYTAAVYAILAYVFEQPVTGLLVSSGIVLGVLGLAFQATLTDIISGIALAVERPFAVGDWVETQEGVIGKVETIDWRATTLRTFLETTHVIPNNKIANAGVHNLSRPGVCYWFMVYVSVSSDLPPNEIRQILLEAALDSEGVRHDPPPQVRLNSAEHKPIRYAAALACDTYFEFPDTRDAFLLEAWRRLGAVGAEFAAETTQVDIRKTRELDFQPIMESDPLGNVELLAPLRKTEKKQLLKAASTHDLAQGTQIVAQGDEGQSFFVLLTGMVRIFLPGANQGQDMELARLGAGSYFGEMSLLTGESRSASISAYTRATLLEIPKSAMAPVLASRPELAEQLATIMAERKLANEGLMRETDERGFADRLGEATRELVSRMRKFFAD